MLRKSLIPLVILLSGLAYGQTQSATLNDELILPNSEGTFQIILADERMIEPTITSDLLEQIEDKRHQSEIVLWEYSPYITIKILSRETVESGDYKPLNTYGYVE